MVENEHLIGLCYELYIFKKYSFPVSFPNLSNRFLKKTQFDNSSEQDGVQYFSGEPNKKLFSNKP